MPFYGNPNVTITAIDTSGGIACSRTSGQTPCFIQVSASAITATGTSKPYEDLEYSWDFGDASGTEIFTNPVTGTSVNANSDQTGPEAAYVYRSAGTYTVTVTIRGKNGSIFTTATKTQNITVTTYSASGGHWYFDSAAAGGGDGSIGAPFNTVAQITTKAAIANTSLHLKKGSNWVGTAGISFSNNGGGSGPLRIDAYGSGADPIVNVSSGVNDPLAFNANGSGTVTYQDVVISGLDLWRSGSASQEVFNGISSNPNATIRDIYLDNVDFVSNLSSGVGSGFMVELHYGGGGTDGSLISNFGIWGGSITAQSGDTGRGIGFYGGARNWNFFVGVNEINGTGGNAVLDHHIYPDFQNHGLFGWIRFGDGTGRNFCINGNWNSASGSLEYAQYWCISGSKLSGTQRAFDAGNFDNDPAKVRFKNYAVQQCAFEGLEADGCVLIQNAESLTFRDAQIWNCDVGRFWAQAGPADASNSVYRVKQYRTGGQTNGAAFDWSNRTWTSAQTFTDNVIVDTQAVAKTIGLDSFANHVSIGSIIDRNQYWISNDSDAKAWYDNTTAKTFAQWQAFGLDVNGSVADPHWLDPANGDFTPFRRRVRLSAAA